MIRAGYSPSVRLFEAAACGTPIISDTWEGIETLLDPDREILLARTPDDVLRVLGTWSDDQRRALGTRARHRILKEHTSAHRAASMEQVLFEAIRHRRQEQPLALAVES
jgi:spore maturation protein CgeB